MRGKNPDITNLAIQWIRRVPFLLFEKQTKGSEVDKTIQLLSGPDKISTPLLCDKN